PRWSSNGCGRAIELVVKEVQTPLARETVIVCQRHPNGELARASMAARISTASTGVLEEDLLVRVEVRIHGIQRHHRRQQCCFARSARDEVAFGHDRATDATVDGG